jgi:ABC-type uncharacterized transport system substrate-binding protein
MMNRYFKNSAFAVILFLFSSILLLCNIPAEANFTGKKILIVMSYHEEVAMEKELQRTFNSLLTGATVKYFWLNTKNAPADGHRKAREAFDLYLDFQPDAVIACNDNAQALFVVPYLKDKVTTPVIFNGVNNDADQYGYPAGNITGVLEKKHYREGISYLQIIDPTINKIAVIYSDNESNRKNLEQIQQEKAFYTAVITQIVRVTTQVEVKQVLNELSKENDALLFLDLGGLQDEKGAFVEETEMFNLVARTATIPTIGANQWEIEAGILCGVIKSDSEQASLTVDILRSIVNGMDVAKVSVVQNRNGRRFLNVTTLKKLGLKLNPGAAIGTRMIITPTS